MPSLRERDGRNLWLILTGAPPSGNSATLSILKALLLSAILTVRLFASSTSRRGKPRPAVHDLQIVIGDYGNARRMQVYR